MADTVLKWYLIERADGLLGVVSRAEEDDAPDDGLGPFASRNDADDALTAWFNAGG